MTVHPIGTTLTADELLAECERRDVVLSVDSGRLRYRCRPGAIDDELRQAIRDHRDELIARLSDPPPTLADWVCAALANGIVERRGLLELARDVLGIHDDDRVAAAVAEAGGVGFVDADGTPCWATPSHTPRRRPAATWPKDAPSFVGVTLAQIRESRESSAGWGPNQPGA